MEDILLATYTSTTIATKDLRKYIQSRHWQPIRLRQLQRDLFDDKGKMTNLATYTSTTIATLSVRFSSVYRALWQPIRLRQLQHRFPSTSLQSHCWQPIRLRQLQHAKQSNYRMQCSWQPIRLRQLQRIHAITMILSTILATYTSTPIATAKISNCIFNIAYL